ncbi:hypothetical protein RJ639_029687 [Escallonia herrerae]|uniref:Uncharacterized protein n=1 Tax=Escallonia herrerae TaxID=1293975 RepID=A0AA89BCZ1_9ASTE|nr:hypothetical protein RJ639_029687 [Escallonia herrerae]
MAIVFRSNLPLAKQRRGDLYQLVDVQRMVMMGHLAPNVSECDLALKKRQRGLLIALVPSEGLRRPTTVFVKRGNK